MSASMAAGRYGAGEVIESSFMNQTVHISDTHTHMYTYVYIWRERDRDRETETERQRERH